MVNLITQRSVVQIHPPQPLTSFSVPTGSHSFGSSGGGDAATSLKWQYTSHHHTVRSPLTLRHRLRIDIHRALNGGVPEQLLLDFDVRTDPAQ